MGIPVVDQVVDETKTAQTVAELAPETVEAEKAPETETTVVEADKAPETEAKEAEVTEQAAAPAALEKAAVPGAVQAPPVTPSTGVAPYPAGEQFCGCTRDFEQVIRPAQTGNAARAPSTICELFRAAVAKGGDELALAVERPAPAAKEALPLAEWTKWSWADYGRDAHLCANAFAHLGVEVFGSVTVWGYNAPEWHMACMGAVLCGAKAAGIYPTDTPEQVKYKVVHSDAAVVVVEDAAKLAKLAALTDELPDVKAVVVYTPGEHASELPRAAGAIPVYAWRDFLALGEGQDVLAEREVRAGHCCGLIYTSGTTGNPKAVMISHDNILFEASTITTTMPGVGSGGQERILSYLPLSHVAGMMVDIVCPMYITAATAGHCAAFFARPNDLKDGTIGERLRFVKPTIFLGVPRVWEKISEKMKAVGAQTKGLKKKIATWAKGKGLKYSRRGQLAADLADLPQVARKPRFYGLAKKLVLDKVKVALGLECCKFAFTGAAPITVETLEYFGMLGINVNEVYGMSECTGATTVSTDATHVWGSCGFAMEGSEVKVFREASADPVPAAADLFHPTEAEQGEICFRGRHIMMGYLANPKLGPEHVAEIEAKTRAAIDEHGWLHSGDKGCVDARGMFRITGRYKELIIGAGGENIAPVPIEDSIKALCPAVSNVMVVGDQRKFNTAVVTLKADGATGELEGTDQLCGPALLVNPEVTLVSQAQQDPVFLKHVEDAIRATNSDPSICQNNAWKIQKFRILPHDFSVVTDELTPTLKLKRARACEIHATIIEEMYA